MRNLLVALIASGAALAANPVKDAVPLFFIANQGQAPPAVRFMAKGSGLTAYFSPGEALFRVAGRAAPGAAATIQNSHCTIDASASTATLSGDTLTMTVAVSFKYAFNGAKTIYLFANDATQNSGWQNMGSWIVP